MGHDGSRPPSPVEAGCRLLFFPSCCCQSSDGWPSISPHHPRTVLILLSLICLQALSWAASQQPYELVRAHPNSARQTIELRTVSEATRPAFFHFARSSAILPRPPLSVEGFSDTQPHTVIRLRPLHTARVFLWSTDTYSYFVPLNHARSHPGTTSSQPFLSNPPPSLNAAALFNLERGRVYRSHRMKDDDRPHLAAAARHKRRLH
jgi:hypothetical protein